MKQLIQDLKNGNTTLEEVPAPSLQEGHVLIRSSTSLVSLGTEKMLVSFGKASWLGKARQQPERVKDVLNKIKTDGLKPTIDAVFSKLDKPLPLGYSNAGIVIGVGKNVQGFNVGDRVVSNGYHAEVVSVPKNFIAKIPDNVTDEAAAFTVVGAIALQGIRLAQPTFGETVVVIGMGLIGQLTAQLLKANGCKVMGIDIDEQKLSLAKNQGIETIVSSENIANTIIAKTNNVGADAVIITATTDSNEIIVQAAQMSRKRGRMILTGVTGLEINRTDFYAKELSFQVSCSYGPGRYEFDYEQKGNDYPASFVRWTAQRNFEAVLQAMSSGQLDVVPLITSRVAFENYKEIYCNLDDASHIAAVLEYDVQKEHNHILTLRSNQIAESKIIAGIIGAGNFANSVVLPILSKQNIALAGIASANGLSATTLAKKYGFARATTDYKIILEDKNCNTVFILTRHNQHAAMVSEALSAGKNVFVEKPIALNETELNDIINIYQNCNQSVTVGFNRRFAPITKKIKSLLHDAPLNIILTINAGTIPTTHWLMDAETSGGRIIGEACHFIDLCGYVSGSAIVSVCANAMNNSGEDVSILLQMKDGSNAVVNYFSNGNKSYEKERMEIYQDGRILIMENWKKLTGFGFNNFSSLSSRQDKGHTNQFNLLTEVLQKGESLIPFAEIINTTKASFAVMESLRQANRIIL